MNLLSLGGLDLPTGAAVPAGTAEGPPFPMPMLADPALATNPVPGAQVAWNAVPEGLATIQTEQPEASAADLPSTLPQICPLEPLPACAPDEANAAIETGAMLDQSPKAGQPPAPASSPLQPSHHARPSGSAHRSQGAPSALPTDSAASGPKVDVADMLASAPTGGLSSTTPEKATDAAPATRAPEDQERLPDIERGQTLGLPSLPAAPVPPPTAPAAHGSQGQSAAASQSIASGSGKAFVAAPAGSTDKPSRPGHAPAGGNEIPTGTAHSGRAPDHERVADAPSPSDAAAAAAASRGDTDPPGEVQTLAPEIPAAATAALVAPDPKVPVPGAALSPPVRSSVPSAFSEPAPRIAIASPRFAQDVGIAISRKPGGLQPGDELVLQIEPADFGQIRVELRFAPDGKLEAVVSADQSRVLDQLRAHAADLHRSLVDAGGRADIAPPRFEARADGASASSSPNSNANPGQAGSGGQSGQHNGHAQQGQRAYVGDPASVVAPQRLRASALPGRLDLIA